MKIIDKILDSYYSKKLTYFIKKFLKQYYIINIKVINKKNCITIQIKKVKYNDMYYTSIFKFKKEEAFLLLNILNNIQEQLIQNCEDYFKNN